ncbi:hypothetical protein NQ318_007532 [Aromia moschata]|uniref:Uncharacterized protein n=1 Tax=Aromia moschata TaxID=1265417 RepID=A0AAV8XNB5_9CUCU|nr:hypothetical protein NQ318_022569 [Aromia moschata]KAJ8949431.1 hypothetical protein NQ318_007532 [Aromia moschata]
MCDITVSEADSTTYPFSSPIRRSPSAWSLDTVVYGTEDEDHQVEPDSTTSETPETPDNLSFVFDLEGYQINDEFFEFREMDNIEGRRMDNQEDPQVVENRELGDYEDDNIDVGWEDAGWVDRNDED